MPATEQTWRSQKLLHVIFGVSAIVMTIATVWLMAKDHNREWKQVQLKDRKKDAWTTQASRDELAYELRTKKEEYLREESIAESAAIDPALLDRFEQLVVAEQRRLAEGSNDPDSLEDAQPGDAKAAASAAEFAAIRELSTELDAAAAEANAAADAESSDQVALRDVARRVRNRLVAKLESTIGDAKFREKNLVATKKAVNGQRTAVVSELGLKVHGGVDQEELDRTQLVIDGLDDTLATLTAQIAAAKDYRTQLEGIVGEINAQRNEAAKELATMEADLARLDDQVAKNTTNAGEWVTRLPILNALYNGNIRITQNWLPDLTINYNFSQVARFDRCATCHRAISKTAPGTATDPLYPTLTDAERNLELIMQASDEELDAESDLRAVYGLALTDESLVDGADVTVQYVLPDSLAAQAGLMSGDVVETINGQGVQTSKAAQELLTTMRESGEAIRIAVKRGLEHPFTAHPRLDLYLTDLSPHPEKIVGCTICHDGQGSGTSFQWTSHTPNDFNQQAEWIDTYGWFDNHHWIFPMKPARFVESNCLKCHHQKGALEPSESFPEPPAPKLVEGWSVVEKYGCFGCHEVNGYAGPGQTIGPDVRLEPNYHEAAAAILTDDGINDRQRDLARRLVEQPTDDAARHELYASITEGEADDLTPQTVKVSAVLKDVENPGQYRKPGPSLRYLDAKVDYDWLYSWIRRPADFRPSTKMPQFFGHWEHLSEDVDAAQLHESMRFEPIEIRALTSFLLKNSQPFEPMAKAAGVTESASAERGEWLFKSRGCLACHAHGEVEGIA
ncbi:MAG: PDZ domain-containing protein, partial [Planctomycetales bacterium]|nr:PDZ domain-containing protein [Planctomycetales bacterium]